MNGSQFSTNRESRFFFQNEMRFRSHFRVFFLAVQVLPCSMIEMVQEVLKDKK